MPSKRHLIVVFFALTALAACDNDQPQTQSDWTSTEQVYRAPAGATSQRPSERPEERLQTFFGDLKSGRIEQAQAQVAKRTLEVSPVELEQNLRQWSNELTATPNALEILDGQQNGDFALVRVRFSPPQATGTDEIRPVILFREEGQWRVVWSLLGKEPERVRDSQPAVAQRLEPLYTWYAQQMHAQAPAPVVPQSQTPSG